MQAPVATNGPLTLLLLVMISRATNRDKGYVTSPALHTFVTEACWRGSSGTGFRLVAICIYTYMHIHMHTYVCMNRYALSSDGRLIFGFQTTCPWSGWQQFTIQGTGRAASGFGLQGFWVSLSWGLADTLLGCISCGNESFNHNCQLLVVGGFGMIVLGWHEYRDKLWYFQDCIKTKTSFAACRVRHRDGHSVLPVLAKEACPVSPVARHASQCCPLAPVGPQGVLDTPCTVAFLGLLQRLPVLKRE